MLTNIKYSDRAIISSITEEMTRLTDTQVNSIAQSCLDSFNKLPKTGKPLEKEWTVLSCVVKFDKSSGNHEVVSLGTGSKCIGASRMCPSGDVLNDSHAEVFARRGFLIYLYDQMREDRCSIFTSEDGRYSLKEHIEFVFYSSQLPCGDASIIPKDDTEYEDDEHFGDVLQLKHVASVDICDVSTKRCKYEGDDIYRTGAKCLPDNEQDLKEEGTKYHLLGQVRTKPGRGDRTLSVSCSDKMAKWIHMGIQGSLLDMLLKEPIYISHFMFGDGVPYSEITLNRAFFKRDDKCVVEPPFRPEFYKSNVTFPHIKNANSVRAAPGSIVWISSNNQTLEVAVQGKKLGLTKKKAVCSNSSLCISKYKLFEKFCELLQNNKELKQDILGEEVLASIPYNEMKRRSKRYAEKWTKLNETFFKKWTLKPDMWNFFVNSI